MRKTLINQSPFLLIAFLFLAISTTPSCSKPREGCLDLNGTNYDVLAELDCCCTYPNLAFTFSSKYSDDPVEFNEFGYTNNLGQKYGLSSGRMLLNNLFLTNDSGEVFEIEDTIELKTNEGRDSMFFKNDFININSLSPKSYILSEIPVDEFYTSLKFSLGFDGQYCDIAPLNLPQNTEITRSLNSLYAEEFDEFFSARIDLVVDSTENGLDIKTIFIPLCQTATEQYSLNKIGTPGFNLEIKMEIDIKEWFDDININTLDSLNIRPELSAKFFSSLKVE